LGAELWRELLYLCRWFVYAFALLISGIGTFIILYAGGYLKGHPQQGRFFSFLFLFMGAMLGLVLGNNLISLFIFWELTSITSFLLIGFDHLRAASRRARNPGAGGDGRWRLDPCWPVSLSSFLRPVKSRCRCFWHRPISSRIPAFMCRSSSGSRRSVYEIRPVSVSFLASQCDGSPDARLRVPAFRNDGQGRCLPPDAHAPASRRHALWTTVLPLFGGVTLLVGTILAVRQTDLKLMLAYTTVASLGLLVMLTGTSHEKALEGAVLYLLAHSLFKGALFMVAGTIDHEAGTRDIRYLGGLRSAMPITFGAACLAALSMSGLPPFIGFIAKEVLYYGTWGWPELWPPDHCRGRCRQLVDAGDRSGRCDQAVLRPSGRHSETCP
jgi:multicomponent Na+:H+ antiporter subunit A